MVSFDRTPPKPPRTARDILGDETMVIPANPGREAGEAVGVYAEALATTDANRFAGLMAQFITPGVVEQMGRNRDRLKSHARDIITADAFAALPEPLQRAVDALFIPDGQNFAPTEQSIPSSAARTRSVLENLPPAPPERRIDTTNMLPTLRRIMDAPDLPTTLRNVVAWQQAGYRAPAAVYEEVATKLAGLLTLRQFGSLTREEQAAVNLFMRNGNKRLPG